MIDSHCHLTYAPLHDQLDGVLQRAADAGVRLMITVGTSIADTHKALGLAAQHSQIRPTAGIHPHDAGKVSGDWQLDLRELARRAEVVAVGETGLDYHYDFADRESQLRVFEAELQIATEVGKPVIIHCREAHRDTMDMLSRYPHLRGAVFHCFTGTMAEAREIWDAGYRLSLTGVATFKKSDELREVARSMPADTMMVETDSPYLSPEPVRSRKPNEPSFVVHTAACIARERGMCLAELDAVTESNTRAFFSL